jgi:hypothetical protein
MLLLLGTTVGVYYSGYKHGRLDSDTANTLREAQVLAEISERTTNIEKTSRELVSNAKEEAALRDKKLAYILASIKNKPMVNVDCTKPSNEFVAGFNTLSGRN